MSGTSPKKLTVSRMSEKTMRTVVRTDTSAAAASRMRMMPSPVDRRLRVRSSTAPDPPVVDEPDVVVVLVT